MERVFSCGRFFGIIEHPCTQQGVMEAANVQGQIDEERAEEAEEEAVTWEG
jgi:hypothetical protein